MTKLLIILIAAISIFQSKPPVERHFFVGYYVMIKDGHYITGNIQWHTFDGQMPIKIELYNFLKKEYPKYNFRFDELAIVGLYEFKNKNDCDFFQNTQKYHIHDFATCLKCNQPGCGCWCEIDTCKYFQEYTTGKIFPSKDSAIAYLKKQKIIK